MQSSLFEEFCWEKQVIADCEVKGDHQNCLCIKATIGIVEHIKLYNETEQEGETVTPIKL